MNPLALAAATAVLAASAGCSAGAGSGPSRAEPSESGGMSASQLERELAHRVHLDDPTHDLDARCHGGLVARQSATQECDLTAGDGEVAVRLTAKDDSGERFDMEPFLRGDDVAAAMVATLEEQGRTGAVVECPGDLAGRVGETIECSVELGGGEGTLVAEVTKVDALMIDFDFHSP